MYGRQRQICICVIKGHGSCIGKDGQREMLTILNYMRFVFCKMSLQGGLIKFSKLVVLAAEGYF